MSGIVGIDIGQSTVKIAFKIIGFYFPSAVKVGGNDGSDALLRFDDNYFKSKEHIADFSGIEFVCKNF